MWFWKVLCQGQGGFCMSFVIFSGLTYILSVGFISDRLWDGLARLPSGLPGKWNFPTLFVDFMCYIISSQNLNWLYWVTLVICWFDCIPEYLDSNINSEHDIFIVVDLLERVISGSLTFQWIQSSVWFGTIFSC